MLENSQVRFLGGKGLRSPDLSGVPRNTPNDPIKYPKVENYITKCYSQEMQELMTKQFSKWVLNQNIPENGLTEAIAELQSGNFEANLGGHLYKKRIRFEGQGKSGSGRTIICYKKGDKAIFIHGFAKNEKSNLSKKELNAFKEFSKVLLGFSVKEISIAIENGDFIEVKL